MNAANNIIPPVIMPFLDAIPTSFQGNNIERAAIIDATKITFSPAFHSSQEIFIMPSLSVRIRPTYKSTVIESLISLIKLRLLILFEGISQKLSNVVGIQKIELINC